MLPVVRRALAVLASFGSIFVVWTLMLVMPLGDRVWLGSLVALAVAAYVSHTVWNGTAEGSTSDAVMAGFGAAILGGLGLVAGFLGPMICAPDANRGPMPGLFITGSAGVVIGAIAGAVYAKRR